MSRRPLAVALFVGVVVGASPLTAQASNAASAGLLLAPLGARLTALGGAGVADTSSVSALFSTPAAYAHATQRAVAFEYAQDDYTKRGVVSVLYPVRYVGTLALSGYGQDLGRIPRTIQSGVEIGTLYYRNVEVGGCVRRRVRARRQRGCHVEIHPVPRRLHG